MNRIDKLFAEKKNNIMSVYYPAGFPNINSTMPILKELQAQGIDMVELGIPFSDPMADGVVIQAAATKALENGISLKLIFSQIENMRNEINIPVILMGYLNPIMHYGFDRFCQSCVRIGVDGVIIPDLPFSDYINEYKHIAEQYGIKVVMFITPETSDDRIRLIDEHSSGFIYMVSVAGTTGSKDSFDQNQQNYFQRIDTMQLHHPRLIGFGISNKATYKAACNNANGAIIGSHFVKILEQKEDIAQSVKLLIESVK